MNLRRMETAAAPGLAVLIVDDDPRIRRLLGVKLRSDGCITYEAADGFEALQILSLSSWNAVILDLNMPGMDGEEFFKRARKRGYRGSIIVLSADINAKLRCARAGVPSIAKPFDPDRVRELIYEQAPVQQRALSFQ
jgi:two-component system, response regulator, stage 0 sporulation protein F